MRHESVWNDTPLMLAVAFGNVEIVNLLVENGIDPRFRDSRRRTGLYVACTDGAEKPGHLELARLFLSMGVGVDDADEYGITPLMGAAMLRSEAILNLLLDAGANVSAASAVSAQVMNGFLRHSVTLFPVTKRPMRNCC